MNRLVQRRKKKNQHEPMNEQSNRQPDTTTQLRLRNPGTVRVTVRIGP
jgi:hypothetical protein